MNENTTDAAYLAKEKDLVDVHTKARGQEMLATPALGPDGQPVKRSMSPEESDALLRTSVPGWTAELQQQFMEEEAAARAAAQPQGDGEGGAAPAIPDSATVSPEEWQAAVQKAGSEMRTSRGVAKGTVVASAGFMNAVAGALDIPNELATTQTDVLETIANLGLDLREDAKPFKWDAEKSVDENLAAAAQSTALRQIPGAGQLLMSAAVTQMVASVTQPVADLIGDEDSIVRPIAKFLAGFALTRGVGARAGLTQMFTRAGNAMGGAGQVIGAAAGAPKLASGLEASGRLAATIAESNFFGATTSFWAMAADENLLSGLEAMGVPIPEYFDYLKYDENRSAFENRFANALTDAGLGLFTDSALGVIRALATGAIRLDLLGNALLSKDMQAARRAVGKVAPEAQIGAAARDFDEIANEALARYERITDALGSSAEPRILTGADAAERLNRRMRVVEGLGLTRDEAHAAVRGLARMSTQADEMTLDTLHPFINYDRINTPNDVHRLISDLAEAAESEGVGPSAARGPRRRLVDVERDSLEVDPVDIMLERRMTGRVADLDDAQLLAVRKLHATMVQDLQTFALAYDRSGVKNESALTMFSKTFTALSELQNIISGAKAEASRRLGALRQTVTADPGSMEFVNQVSRLVDQAGSDKVAADLAKMVVEAGRMGNKQLLDIIDGAHSIDTLGKAATAIGGTVRKVWYFSLLGRVGTLFRATVGTGAFTAMNIAETEFAWLVGKALGTNDTQFGEGFHMFYGALQGYKDALRLPQILKALREGTTNDPAAAARGLAVSPNQMKEALDGGVYKAFREQTSGFGIGRVDTVDEASRLPAMWGVHDEESNLYRALWTADAVLSTPLRGIVALDEFFKTGFARMEAHRAAYRRANALFDAGQVDKAGWYTAYDDVLRKPTEADKLIQQRAAQVGTFTNQIPKDSKVGGAMKALRDVPVIGKAALPFQNTPYNIAWQGIQRSPLGMLNRTFWRDIYSGDSKRVEMAWSRFLLSNLTMLALVDTVVKFDNVIRLVGDPASPEGERAAFRQLKHRRRLGETPREIHIARNWTKGLDAGFVAIPYTGYEPIAFPIAMAAQISELIHADGWDNEDADMDQLWFGVALGMADQSLSMQMVTGVADLFTALDDVNDVNTGVQRWAERQMASLALPGAVAQFTDVTDEYHRTAFGLVDTIMSRTPLLSEMYPIAHDLWGRPRTKQSGWTGILGSSSWRFVDESDMEPVDKWLRARRELIGRPGTGEYSYRNGVSWNWKDHPGAYERWLVLTGQEMDDPKREDAVRRALINGVSITEPVVEDVVWRPVPGGLLHNLNLLVEGKHPNGGMQAGFDRLDDEPEGGQVGFINKVLSYYRRAAIEVLLGEPEFADLRAEVEPKMAERELSEKDPTKRRRYKMTSLSEAQKQKRAESEAEFLRAFRDAKNNAERGARTGARAGTRSGFRAE